MNLKLIKAKYLVMIFAALFVATANAQTTDQTTFAIKNLLPTSPEAALLGRFGDIPVGMYTGTADISIPIYTIKENGLEIPIALNYHSSGIKVEDMASNVGLGWLLEPGGAIIQITNGLEDNQDNFVTFQSDDYAYLKSHLSISGYHGARYQIGTAAFLCTGNPGDGGDSYSEMQGILNGSVQPDIFQYNFPGGYSGKFYINPETNLPVLIDKKKQITFIRDGVSSWTAITLDGNKYHFTAQETSSDGTAHHDSHTWKLTQIELSNGKTVNLQYQQGTYHWTNYSETYHSGYPVGANINGVDPPLQYSPELLVQPHTTGINNTVQTITQISTDEVIINFNLTSRLDMTIPAIQSIDIYSVATGKKLKTFTLNYSYFDYTSEGNNFFHVTTPAALDSYGKRLKLLSVQEAGYATSQAITNPPYQFTYNDNVLLPLRTSYERDFWGYYNGITKNNTLTSDLSYLYATQQTPGSLPFYMLTAYQTSNRAPDTSKISAGILTKIQYPTGGYSTFKYEPNSFSNYDYPDSKKLSNFTATTNIYVSDMNSPVYQTTATFSVPMRLTVPITCYFGKGIPTNTVTFNDMLNATIKLNQISGGVTTTLKQWNLTTDQRSTFDANGGITIQDSYAFNGDASVQYQVVAYLPDGLGNQNESSKNASVTCTITNIPKFAPNNGPKLSYGGGVRIKSTQNYDKNGILIGNKSYAYINEDGTTSGILMSPLQLVYSRPMHFEYLHHFGADPNTNDLVKDVADAEIWWVSSESVTPFSNAAGGNIVGYSRVVETELGTGGDNNGSVVHFYHDSPSETGYNTPDNPDLQNGEPSVEQIFDKSGNKLEETTYSYTSLADQTFNAFKAIYNEMLNYDCVPFTIRAPSYPATTYLLLNYPINSKWYVLSGKTHSKFLNGVTAATTETYQYNTLGQLAQSNVTNSKGEILTTNYKFPIDIPDAQRSAAQQALIAANLYNSLVEQHELNNQVETASAMVTYATIDNQLVKSEVDRSYNSKPSFKDVTFDRYGPNKTLRQFTQKGSPVVILWSYNNRYPVAEIKNADLATVISVLGNGGVNVDNLGNQVMPTDNDINNIRSAIANLPNAQVTTYIYDPVIGLTSMKDPTGITTYYEYDSLQRLMNIKNKDGNIIKHMDYHYQNN